MDIYVPQIANQLQIKIVILSNPTLEKLWILEGNVPKCGWDVTSRKKEAPNASRITKKPTPAWVRVHRGCDPEALVQPAHTLPALSFCSSRPLGCWENLLPKQLLLLSLRTLGGALWILLVRRTCWDFWVVYFLSFPSFPTPSWRQDFNTTENQGQQALRGKASGRSTSEV